MQSAAVRRDVGAIFGAAATSPDSSFGERRVARRQLSSKIGAPSLISFLVVLCLRMRFCFLAALCQLPSLLLFFRAHLGQ
jgi:hypothetical protein